MSAVLSLVSADADRRQRAIDRLSLAAVPDEPVLDGVVRMAARMLRCNVAMINVVSAEGAWSIASTDGPHQWLRRESVFCSTVADHKRAMVIPDLSKDLRFERHPLVTGEPRLRFYAGLPIGDGEHILGSLCVLGETPRTLDDTAFQTLEDLACVVTHWLTSRRERVERLELEARQREGLHALVALRTAELESARDAAEAASAAKSAFLATMSHEIRTPMNGVIGLIELMDRSGLPPHQQELMHSARESAHALLSLIDDILDFSKIESGHMELDDAPFELRRLIEGTADAWLGTACQQRVALHVFVQPDLPPVLMGDAVRLRQVIANLVGNAVKFSGGRNRTGHVSLRAFAQGGGLAIEVRDDGIGMAPEAIERLFRPFQQAELSTTRRFGGTGLGLAISQRLALGMGGRITVASTPQAGSCFTVHLPLRAAADTVADLDVPVNLTGVRCTWHGQRPAGLDDWRCYLQAAGAEVALVDAAAREPGTLGEWQIEQGSARGRIALRPGPQRGARADAHGLLWLDTDALHRRALLQAVRLAIEPAHGASVAAAEADPAAWRMPASTAPVLVAEDNPVNRLVIGRQLQRLGVPAVIVNDGEAALARWRADGGRFSVLLTDLHMPGLDGEALCAAIRTEETGGRRLPIVALTANAVRGEAERAVAAGMDDYLTKPVPLERLAAALRRWLPPVLGAAEAAEPPAPADFDPEALQRAIGADPEAQDEMRQIFLGTLDGAERDMREAMQRGDWLRAGLAAHKVKSSSHAVGAHRLGRLFDDFERAARAGQIERLGALVRSIGEAAVPVRQTFAH